MIILIFKVDFEKKKKKNRNKIKECTEACEVVLVAQKNQDKINQKQ